MPPPTFIENSALSLTYYTFASGSVSEITAPFTFAGSLVLLDLRLWFIIRLFYFHIIHELPPQYLSGSSSVCEFTWLRSAKPLGLDWSGKGGFSVGAVRPVVGG